MACLRVCFVCGTVCPSIASALSKVAAETRSRSFAKQDHGLSITWCWHLRAGRLAASARLCPCSRGQRRLRPLCRGHHLPRPPRPRLLARLCSRRGPPAWRGCARPRCGCWARCCVGTRWVLGARCWRPAACRTCAPRSSARRCAHTATFLAARAPSKQLSMHIGATPACLQPTSEKTGSRLHVLSHAAFPMHGQLTRSTLRLNAT